MTAEKRNLKSILSIQIDESLVKMLIECYKNIKQAYFLEEFEKCQLNCGKFVEIMSRILEFINNGCYTPLNKSINLDKLINQLESNSKLYDSIRFHIPKILRTIYDIRNRRGVAHIGEFNPNSMDSNYVVSACDWILSELIRIYYTDDLINIENIIKSINEKNIPIIEEFGNDLLVLEPKFSVATKILLILYHKYPNVVLIEDLKNWIKTCSKSYITTVLIQLEKRAKIFKKEKSVIITKKGINSIKSTLLRKIQMFE